MTREDQLARLGRLEKHRDDALNEAEARLYQVDPNYPDRAIPFALRSIAAGQIAAVYQAQVDAARRDWRPR